MHEEPGGCDLFGARPQDGVALLHAEMDALTFKGGTMVAVDDVTGNTLVAEMVKKARAEEMECFKKLGVL